MLSLFILGCGGGQGTSNGIVQFSDGEPVQSGSIEFRSLANGARFASRIKRDGTFMLTDSSGDPKCPPGKYEVVVVQIVLTEDLAAEKHTHGTTVPRRYADYYTSGLKVSVPDQAVDPITVVLEPDAL